MFLISIAFIVALAAAAGAAPDAPYEEMVATRLTFAPGPNAFPVLAFSEVAHTAVLGTTSVAVLASSPAWALFAADTAVVGPEAVKSLTVDASVPLQGACIAPGRRACSGKGRAASVDFSVGRRSDGISLSYCPFCCRRTQINDRRERRRAAGYCPALGCLSPHLRRALRHLRSDPGEYNRATLSHAEYTKVPNTQKKM